VEEDNKRTEPTVTCATDEELVPESGGKLSPSVDVDEVEESGDDVDDRILDLGGINDDIEESSVLEDIERNAQYNGLGSGSGNLADFAGFGTTAPPLPPQQLPTERGRSSSMTYARNRAGRKNSIDSNEYGGFDDVNGTHATGFRLWSFRFHAAVHYLTPGLHRRINAYLLVLFLIVISLVARGFDAPRRLFLLYICTVLLEFGCSVLDRMVHKLIDVLFESRFDICYQLHALNGPLGMIITILVVRNYWQFLAADEILPHWKDYVTGAAVFVICLCAKNWLGRRQYVYLLESRFTDKVESLNSMIIILSELASTRPPKSVQLQRAVTLTNGARRRSRDKSAKFTTSEEKVNYGKKVMDVFQDLVETTAEDSSDDGLTRKVKHGSDSYQLLRL
jgi:hypothetical protein